MLAASIAPDAGAQQDEPELLRRAFFGYRTNASSPAGMIPLTHVVEGSGAEAAGLRPNDVIVDVEGNRRPLDRRTMLHAIRSRRPGDVLTISYRRDGGRVRTVEVTLGTFPKAEFASGGRVRYLAAEVPEIPGPEGPTLVRLLLLLPVDPDSDRDWTSGSLSEAVDDAPPRPLVVLVSSMRCVSLDESLSSNAPSSPEFAYARQLLARGIAVLMVDRPGLGDSQGPPCESLDWDQEHAVFRAALTRIARDPRIDPQRVAVAGLGTGGYHAAALAQASQVDSATGGPLPRVRAVAAVGVDDRPWTEYIGALLRRTRYPAPGGDASLGPAPQVGLTPEEIEAHLEVHRAVAVEGLTVRETYAGRPELRRTGYPSGTGFLAGRGPAYFRQLEQMHAVTLFARVTSPKLFARDEDDAASFAGALERLGRATGGEWISSDRPANDVAMWLAAELGVREP